MKIIRLNTMQMVKGDTECIKVTCSNYEFQDGDKVEFSVRKQFDGEEVIHKTVEEFEEGSADIKLLPSDTNSLELGEYKYDIKVYFWNDDVKTIIPSSIFEIRE